MLTRNAPAPDLDNAADLGISAEAYDLWKGRDDLRDAFPLNSQQEVLRYLGWWLWSISEGETDHQIDGEWLTRTLSRPAPWVEQAGPFAITHEMYALWCFVADLKARYDLTTSHGKIGLLSWYLFFWRQRSNLRMPDWAITALASLSPGTEDGRPGATTLLAHAIWKWDSRLREAYSITDPASADPLRCWAIWHLPSNLRGYFSRGLAHLSADQLFDHWIEGHQHAPGYVKYCRTHRTRLLATYRRLEPHLRNGQEVLEVGGLSFLAFAITVNYPETVVTGTTTDLRYELPLPDDRFDVVIFTEVLEHLKDRDSSDLSEVDQFTFSGVNSLMSELRRVSRNGSVMLLSTPNVSALGNIAQILKGEHPFMYKPHVREFAPAEVLDLVRHHRFELLSFETQDVWATTEDEDRDLVTSILKTYGFDLANRGDCTFVTARKSGD